MQSSPRPDLDDAVSNSENDDEAETEAEAEAEEEAEAVEEETIASLANFRVGPES